MSDGDCDDVLAALLLGDSSAGDTAAHVRDCARCRDDEGLVLRLRQALAADARQTLAPGLSTRALAAAAPLLARNARRSAWRRLGRAVAAAVVPLPFILALDAWVVRTAYHLLSLVLPGALSIFVAANYAALLALLLALTYGAVPILAERQGLRFEESHG
jgi:hypothetical protein